MTSLGGLSPERLDLVFRKLREKRGTVAADRIEPRGSDAGSLPLSFSQQRLWFLDRLRPGSAAYHVPTVLHLTGRLDPSALEASLGEISRRHEALRTVFPAEEGEPRQEVLPWAPGEPRLATVDLTGLPDSRRQEEAQQRTAEEARRPFDLTAGPLLRAFLLRLGNEEHLLAAVQHHILSDAWSKGILIRELAALYTAFSEGRPSPLPELPVQYADFALWQRRVLSGDRSRAEAGFWREALRDAPPELALPADRPHPSARTDRGVDRAVCLSMSADLRTLALRSEATTFMVLLAAFQALLARWTGEVDVSVGTPVAGRHRSEVEGLIGLFVNTLVLRTDLGGDPTFSDLVARVRAVTLDAYAHQELPFEKLVEELAPERRLDRTPLFRALFALQNTPRTALALPGLTLELPETGSRAAKLDLTLTLQEEPDGISGWLTLSADLFEATTAERLGAAFERLLAAAVERPALRLSELPLLGGAERHALTVEWAGAGVPPLEPETCLGDLFKAQAARTPDAVALFADSEKEEEEDSSTLTYRELAGRARELAGRLRGMGVGPGTVVGLCAERSPELVVGVLGVLEAGGAYLPLDPSYPRERLALLVEDAAAPVLLTQHRLLPLLPENGARILLLDGNDGDPPTPTGSPPPSVTPDDLAYVIYTSGSTGRPKGVAVPHRGVVNRLLQAQRLFRLGPSDAVLQNASIGFDFSVWEILAPLIAGALLVLARPGGHRDPAYLARLIAKRRVTIAHFVPSMLEAFLDRGESRSCGSLRLVLAGGEALSPALRDRFFARLGCAFTNEYGPTEATIDATWGALNPEDEGAVSIGRPIPGCMAHILDRALSPVLAGAPGELFLGGVCLARGYLGRPDLTAERFVPSPFGRGERLYRTGDLARFRTDGRIDFLGRADHQVKIRGFRIEPGEVEAALRACPAVREAAVLVLEEPGGGHHLAAFVSGSQALDAHELRRALEAQLPAFLVPSRFTVLDSLPLNPHGKLDRGALAGLEVRDEKEEAKGEVPATPAEELLAQIWCDLLGVERVGRQDGFFDLGGHSLLVVRLIARIRETFGVDLEVRTVFEAPTLADLAVAVTERLAAGSAPAERLARQPREGDVPLSFAQERIWFLDQLGTAGAYVVRSAFRLRGALDARALRLALTEVARRHETLRTTFGQREGSPYQVIDPDASVLLPVADLSGLAPHLREAEMDQQLAEEAGRPFDLERGPLLRALVLRLGEDESAVALALHHIVSDGWSAGVLVRELSALYPAFAAGGPSPLPELPVQYADYAIWQRRTLSGERLAGLVADWRGRLAGIPDLALPTDRPRPTWQEGGAFRGVRRAVSVPAGTAAALQALGRGERVTLFMTLLAAWQALLGRYSGQDDFPVGTPVANRGRGEVQGLIGFFVNSLVLRADLAGDPPFRELLRRVREAALAAYVREELPFEKLVEELRPERQRRDGGRNPLFQVLFTLQEDGPPALRLGGLALEPIDLETTTAKLDLTLVCASGEDGELRAGLELSTDLFDAATGERMLEHFANLLGEAADDSGRRLSDLDILGDAERRQILSLWDGVGSEYPRDVPIHVLFEEQAQLYPNRIALVDGDRELTYGELADRAGRLVLRLRERGVGTDTLVGVALERSAEMVVAYLAVLAAGGAYVPLDPAESRERTEILIEEVGLRFLFSAEGLDVREGARSGSSAGLACVLFTSGSTGRPKAVGIEHRGIVRLVRGGGFARFGPEEVFLQLAPPAFDAATLEIWGPLLHGGRLVLFPGRVPSLAELAEALARHRVTTLWLSAGLFHQVVETDAGILRPVSQLLAGGDVLDPAAVQRARAALPGCDLINGYGPTENTTFTCCWTATGPLPPGASVPIGRPIAGTQVYVVDRSMRPVPIGVPGELVTGGDGLARGYLGRPDLTAERFVPDPFANIAGESGGRLYRTGDRVRIRSFGSLEFLGRLDRQVKIRGFRIEPEGVEAVLAGHPRVQRAAVVVAERFGEKALAAFVVPQPAAGSTTVDEEPASREALAAELRRFLRGRLPEPMVPAVVVLDSLPLNSNGKVDRAALSRRGDAGARSQASGTTPPRSPIEEQLAALWAGLLGVESIGVHDDFFELGGHSLLGIRLMSRIRDAFGVDLGVQALFAAPTVAGLAEALVGRLVELADDDMVAAAFAEI